MRKVDSKESKGKGKRRQQMVDVGRKAIVGEGKDREGKQHVE